MAMDKVAMNDELMNEVTGVARISVRILFW